MTEKMPNAPTPGLIYPKSSGLYLMSRVQELTANVADLIETLCQRDRTIAEMERQISQLRSSHVEDLEARAPGKDASNSNGAAATA